MTRNGVRARLQGAMGRALLMASVVVVQAVAPTAQAAPRDFDGDGRSDLSWRHEFNGTALWLMNGLTPLAAATLVADPNWYLNATADFDGDGKADLLFESPARRAIWLMDGLAVKASGFIDVSTDWSITHIGDFDGDGKATCSGATARPARRPSG